MKEKQKGSYVMLGSMVFFIWSLAGISRNCMAMPAVSVADAGRVNVRAFKEYVVDQGKEKEDWQPAFQKALEECGKKGATLFVPCGVYKIRKAIQVPQAEVIKGFMNPGRLTIKGDGRFQSIIQQQVDTENVLDWSGPTYKESYAGGTLKDIALCGGKTCLNIKWHNQFNLDNCYIAGAEEYGIYAEGWSSRFSNAIVRHCKKAGIRGAAHFNNIVIRDSYLSRDKIGISLGSGNGIRIIGVGIESCSDSAIAVMNSSSVSIRDCYFEGNAHPDVNYLGKKGKTFPNVVHLDAYANDVVISGCIFRGGKGYWNANQVGVMGGVNHTIRENRFSNCHVAIKLLRKSAFWDRKDGELPKCLRVTQNDFHITNRVKKYRIDRKLPASGRFLVEAAPGLIEKARAAGCEFEKPALSNIGSEDDSATAKPPAPQVRAGTQAASSPTTLQPLSDEKLGPELMRDGGMEEEGMQHYRKNKYDPAVFEKTDKERHSGRYAMHLVSDSSGDGFIQVFNPRNPLKYYPFFKKRYQVMLWVKNADPAGYNQISIRGTDLKMPLKTSGSEWTRFVFFCQSTKFGGTQYVGIGYGSKKSDCYVDDISIREILFE